MRKVLTALLLLTALIAPVSAADKPIDVEEYASIEALASAIAAHVPVAQGAGKGPGRLAADYVFR